MTIRMKPKLVAALMLSGVCTASLVAQETESPEALLGAAIHQEEVEGDLEAAIRAYTEFLARYPDNGPLAADALMRLGRSYETLGRVAEARAQYERLTREYAAESALANQARERLDLLAQQAMPPNPSGVTLRQVWSGPDVDLLGAPSSDGRYLSYVDWTTGALTLRDLETGQSRPLTDGEPGEYASYSRISPDGRRVAYVWANRQHPYHLRVAGLDDLARGIEPRVLYQNTPGYMELGDWSPDGAEILTNIRGIELVSAADGAIRTLKSLDRESGRPSPRFSPDGQWIAYDLQPGPESPDRDIFVMAADGTGEAALVENPGDDFLLGWAPDGERILFASDRAGVLGAWLIRLEDGRPRGEPELVQSGLGDIVPMGITRAGRFFYGVRNQSVDVEVVNLDRRTGRVTGAPALVSERFQGRASSPAWSPDGRSIAYLSNRREAANLVRGSRAISIRSMETGEERELDVNLAFESYYRLHFSPDGRFLLATATDGAGRSGLYRIDVRDGDVVPIVLERSRPYGVWSRDGTAVYYTHRETPSSASIRKRDLETGQDTEIYRSTTPLNNLALSPNGRWLAFGRGEFVIAEVLMLVSANGGDARELVRIDGGDERMSGIEWSADGDSVFFIRGSGAFDIPGLVPEVWRVPVESGEPTRTGLTAQNYGTLASHPDGRRIAFTAGETRQEVWVMENFLTRADTEP